MNNILLTFCRCVRVNVIKSSRSFFENEATIVSVASASLLTAFRPEYMMIFIFILYNPNTQLLGSQACLYNNSFIILYLLTP